MAGGSTGVLADLRSDLMAGCSEAVVTAIARAALRAPAFLRDEDPDERALTGLLAQWFGQEAALLVPTCTMANQIALRLWCRPGDAVLAAATSHIATVERRATALSSVALVPAREVRGHLPPDGIEHHLGRQGVGNPGLVWLENTCMRAGGTVMPPGWQKAIAAACGASSIRLHLDGSRLWNAVVAGDGILSAAAEGADTVSVSLNKALGAPLGAVLVGSNDAIGRAAEIRSQLGGAWRPIGLLAAAARAALHGWHDRIAHDHIRAARLASLMGEQIGEAVATPETNILLLACRGGQAHAMVRALEDAGVFCLALDPNTVRMVVHRGVADADVPRVAAEVVTAVRRVHRA